jgi:protoporphyrinogen IX oxidase
LGSFAFGELRIEGFLTREFLMNFHLLYPWIKALHVASALVFFAGLVLVSVLLWATSEDLAAPKRVVTAVRRWDRAVTTPAMLLVWALGIVLASESHAFGDIWLQVKLAVVMFLSALHGVQSGKLRRMRQGGSSGAWHAGPVIVVSAVVIAILVVVKPF